MSALGGRSERDICRDSFRALSSSSSMQVSTTMRNIGGTTWARGIVYSRVENCGISSAGWFCSLIAEYWGGKVFRLKQKLQTHNFARKSTWHIGLRTALQVCLAQVTGSYWIGGKSGRSLRGVYSAARGTTILVASSLDDGHTFQERRIPSRSSLAQMYSWYVDIFFNYAGLSIQQRSARC